MYVGPQDAQPAAPAPAAPGMQTTQTVYGFLDFTTTIGNTVMVFSPQSAPAPTTAAPATPAPVIETRPPAAVTSPSPAAIQPSKPTATKQQPIFSSVVEVRGGDLPITKVSNYMPNCTPVFESRNRRILFPTIGRIELNSFQAKHIIDTLSCLLLLCCIYANQAGHINLVLGEHSINRVTIHLGVVVARTMLEPVLASH